MGDLLFQTALCRQTALFESPYCTAIAAQRYHAAASLGLLAQQDSTPMVLAIEGQPLSTTAQSHFDKLAALPTRDCRRHAGRAAMSYARVQWGGGVNLLIAC